MRGMHTITHQPVAVAPDGGSFFHFLNHLATVKVAHDATESRVNVTRFDAPRGFGPPLHVHHHEDEVAYVIDGEIRFRAGDVDTVATAGTVVVLPRAVPHTFQVQSPSASFLAISAGSHETTSSFDRFVGELGEPLAGQALPAPVEIDPGRVAGAGAAHGIEIVGPPPGPLA